MIFFSVRKVFRFPHRRCPVSRETYSTLLTTLKPGRSSAKEDRRRLGAPAVRSRTKSALRSRPVAFELYRNRDTGANVTARDIDLSVDSPTRSRNDAIYAYRVARDIRGQRKLDEFLTARSCLAGREAITVTFFSFVPAASFERQIFSAASFRRVSLRISSHALERFNPELWGYSTRSWELERRFLS